MDLKIVQTFTARVLAALAAFALAIVLSRNGGPEGRGEAALIILAVAWVQQLVQITGGPVLVYLVPKYSLRHLWGPAALLNFPLAFLGWLPLYILGFLPKGWELEILGISLIQGISALQQNLLLGLEKTRTFNTLFFLQPMVLLAATYLGYLFTDEYTLIPFINGLYLAYSGMAVAGAVILFRKSWVNTPERKSEFPFRELFFKGWQSFVANVSQFLNYRLNYYLITIYLGAGPLGLYSNAIALAESVWIVPRSISTIQYSRLVNNPRGKFQHLLTAKYLRLSFFTSFTLVFLLCIIPDSVYMWLFGGKFEGIQYLLWLLMPGILALSIQNVSSNFFSGLGNFRFNGQVSMLGLVFIGVGGWLLIPRFGLTGAAINTSISFLLMAGVQLMHFRKSYLNVIEN